MTAHAGGHVQQCQCHLPHQVCGWRVSGDTHRDPAGAGRAAEGQVSTVPVEK